MKTQIARGLYGNIAYFFGDIAVRRDLLQRGEASPIDIDEEWFR